MVDIALFTAAQLGHALPALEFLPHHLHAHPFNGAEKAAERADLVLVDGTHDLVTAKRFTQRLHTLQIEAPVLLVVKEESLAALHPDWCVRDFIVADAGPAEIEARIRLLTAASVAAAPERHDALRVGGLVIDEDSYAATFRGRTLDLTYKEFELLRYLAAHPDVVVTRERLLDEVWGIDYYGGTRTVDVHIRRLRAKLGDNERIIGTVRNVGYRMLRPQDETAQVSHTQGEVAS